MKVHQDNSDDIVILRLEGDLHIYNAQVFRDHMKMLSESERYKVIVNMDLVPYIDSSGIGALISAVTALKKAGGGMKLCRVSEAVMQVLTMTKLTGFFEIYETEPDAIGAFRK